MAPLMVGDYVTVTGTMIVLPDSAPPSNLLEVNNLVVNLGRFALRTVPGLVQYADSVLD